MARSSVKTSGFSLRDIASLLVRPAVDAHKYTRGVVGLRTGSPQYPGAAMLSVAGANCGLAGMVRYVGDSSIAARLSTVHPEVVGPGTVDAWVVGCGSGEGARLALDEVLLDDVPTVIDADALIHARGLPAGRYLLTPHAGELARMLGADRAEIEAHPARYALDAALEFGAVVLLKGPHTYIATPERQGRVITNGTPWLATAGSGDVLAGFVGALAASGLDLFDAATAGAWIHAEAGKRASGGGPVIASDIAATLRPILKDILK